MLSYIFTRPCIRILKYTSVATFIALTIIIFFMDSDADVKVLNSINFESAIVIEEDHKDITNSESDDNEIHSLSNKDNVQIKAGAEVNKAPFQDGGEENNESFQNGDKQINASFKDGVEENKFEIKYGGEKNANNSENDSVNEVNEQDTNLDKSPDPNNDIIINHPRNIFGLLNKSKEIEDS